MPANSPSLRIAVAKAGYAAQRGDAERIEQTRRDLAAARLEDYIKKVVDAAPPLTATQRADLALLLYGAPATAGAA